MCSATTERPDTLTRLEAAYGGPSQTGFGSAVFNETLADVNDLTLAAIESYRTFLGLLWRNYGEAAWMGSWRAVHVREPGARPDIVAELRGIADPDTRQSVPMILDHVEGAETARGALSAVFDDQAVTELRVFNLGDGEALSGLLVAGRRGDSGESAVLVFLMD